MTTHETTPVVWVGIASCGCCVAGQVERLDDDGFFEEIGRWLAEDGYRVERREGEQNIGHVFGCPQLTKIRDERHEWNYLP